MAAKGFWSLNLRYLFSTVAREKPFKTNSFQRKVLAIKKIEPDRTGLDTWISVENIVEKTLESGIDKTQKTHLGRSFNAWKIHNTSIRLYKIL